MRKSESTSQSVSRSMWRSIERITLISFVVGSVLVPTSAWAQSWTTKAPMPTARGQLASGVIAGVLYVAGGFNGIPGGQYSATYNEAYDAATDTWTVEASMPEPSSNANGHGAAVNGIFYVMGGNNGFVCSNAVQAYDPSTNTWSFRSRMPTGRCNHVLAVVNGLIYVLGGRESAGGFLTSVDVYNPATDSWSAAAPMPTARQWPIAAASGGLIYVIGGQTAAPASMSLGTNEAYDPAANTWTTKASMPTPRQSMARGVLNGRVYVVGGSNNPLGVLATNESYDPATDTWRAELPLPDARDTPGSDVIGNTLYVVGGFNSAGMAEATNYAFTPGEMNTPGNVTGGGYIQPDDTMTLATLLIESGLNASVGDKATFGFVVNFAAGDPNPTGNLRYDDHAASVRITALSFTLLNIGGGVCGASTHAKIRGSATVTGPSGVPATQDFEVEVDDCGRPSSGSGPDTFKITTTGPTPYMAMGPVVGGNITIHKQ